jgi:hypothetical protein
MPLLHFIPILLYSLATPGVVTQSIQDLVCAAREDLLGIGLVENAFL